MYKKLKKRKMIDCKLYNYSQGFASKTEAKAHAERKRKDWRLKARVVKGKTMYIHGKGKGKTMWRVYTRKGE